MADHYLCRYNRPHPASKFSFLVRSFEWLDSVDLRFQFEPMDHVPGASRDAQYVVRLNNELYDSVRATTRREVEGKFQQAGVSINAAVDALIEADVDNQMRALSLSERLAARSTTGLGFASHFDLHARILHAAYYVFTPENSRGSENARCSAVAAALNGDARRDGKPCLSADHVRRAVNDRFFKDLVRASLRFAGRDELFWQIYQIMAWHDRLTVRALDYLWRLAAKDSRFKKYHGSALADAIQEHRGMRQCVTWWFERARPSPPLNVPLAA
ncbi:hypothetical protein M2281_001614 [Mesorhizobium soli]|uniref:hypothetical protein n=1 Tax=Pseudaminobacter soli (ex Li et al. 2025) TaxID=1295366 RepID=UPI00247402A0|nr:hypothetical protein [Mesorhizobium soli]MDH6231042.1 hypothetical protein [Mesorhizobium soli]